MRTSAARPALPAVPNDSGRTLRRRLLRAAAGALVLATAPVAFPPAARAQSAGTAAPDYLVLPQAVPVATPAPDIEVLALFWYGCPHCYRLEPKLVAWSPALPADVRLRRMPAVLTESWRPAARLHYALHAAGAPDAMHLAVFEAEHASRSLQVQSRDAEPFAAWAEKQGIPRAAFTKAWDSAEVATLVARAEEATRPLRRIGVPALIIDGRYVVTASQAGSPDRMLEVALRLAGQVRQERTAR